MEKVIKPILYVIAAIIVFQFLSGIVVKKFDYFKNNKSDPSIVTVEERERQLECLARNIYHEAGNEPFEGKVAVAQVTINRSESGIFPSDLCKVIYQKNKFMEKVVCQFSWYCDGPSKMKLIANETYDECYKVAKKVLLEGFRLPSLTEALYYHADYVNPGWKKERVGKIGRHIFYKA